MTIKIGVEDHNEKLFDKVPRSTEVIKCKIDTNRILVTNCYLHLVSYTSIWGKDVDVCMGGLHEKSLEDNVNLIVIGMLEKVLQ